MSISFNTQQVTVGPTATLIVAINFSRHAILITNLGTTDIWIGDSPAVTPSTGQLLLGLKGAAISIPTNGPVYGITAGGNQAVSFTDI